MFVTGFVTEKQLPRTWYSYPVQVVDAQSVLCTMTSELSEMMESDIKDQNLVVEYSKAKKQNAQTCLSSPCTFRLWQILVFLFIMAIIITVVGIVAARFGPRSECLNSNKTSGVLSTTKQNRGNLTFLPFRYLVSIPQCFLGMEFVNNFIHSSFCVSDHHSRPSQCVSITYTL